MDVLSETPFDTASLLVEFPVITEIPVLWGDQDAFNHVNNVAYLRWCETARVQYLARIGSFPDMPPRGLGPIIASVTCNYRKQLRYPDTVAVGTCVASTGNSSFRMEQRIVSRGIRDIVAEAVSTIVIVDYSSGKPHRVPESFRAAIAQLESRG